MGWFTMLAIAISLGADAFAVAAATGFSLGRVSPRQAFRLSFHFGLFQALMPALGWMAGSTVHSLIAAYDHWVAFLLLAVVGGHMVKSAFHQEDTRSGPKGDPTKGLSLVMLSVATSIDAFAVGLSMAFMKMSILAPCLVIGVVAAAMTLSGMRLGTTGRRILSRRMEAVAGIVLILIGARIVLTHLMERGG